MSKFLKESVAWSSTPAELSWSFMEFCLEFLEHPIVVYTGPVQSALEIIPVFLQQLDRCFLLIRALRSLLFRDVPGHLTWSKFQCFSNMVIQGEFKVSLNGSCWLLDNKLNGVHMLLSASRVFCSESIVDAGSYLHVRQIISSIGFLKSLSLTLIKGT